MTNVQPSTLGLRHVGLLQDLAEERLSRVAARCKWRTVPEGMLLVGRESEDRDVHFIVGGRVRVTTFSAGGREVSFREDGAGAVVGELAAIDGKPRSADVVALESVLVASLDPDGFRQLLDEEPLVRERVLQSLAGLVRSLSERVIDLSTLGVQNRIYAELLRLARLSGQAGPQARIDPAPRHADMASRVSTYREQVTRELSILTRQGLLARDGNALVLLDVPRLEQLVAQVRNTT